MRKFVISAFVVLVGISLVAGGEYAVTGLKISDDGKTATGFKKGKKGKKGDEVKLSVSSKVKVVKGMFNKDTKKVEAGDAIEGGLKADVFKGDKGTSAFIVTEGEGDKETIVEIRVTGKKKKAAAE